MINGLLGKKIGMTHIFNEAGEFVPVTVVEAGPCPVLQVKSPDKDGYSAVQLGFDDKREALTNKPQMGRFRKISVSPVRFIKELRVSDIQGVKPADKVTVDIFSPGDYVDITGTSIGKGFQGGMKRWHWKGGPETHGSTSHRAPGSIGASSDPSRVFKGHHLPGHMGNRKITEQNLEVVKVDKENNCILIKGAVTGHKGSYLIIKKALKKKKKEPKPQVETKAQAQAKTQPKPQAKAAAKKPKGNK